VKVSVIIPVYNQEELIIRCLDSIPKRDDIEIIVVNDGSTDKTLESLYAYRKKYPKLQIISYKVNHGVSYARNKAIDKAVGKYIIFIDSDDYIITDVFNDIVDNDLDFVDIVFYNMIDNEGNEYVVNKYRTMNRVGAFKFILRKFIGDTRFKVGVQRGEDAIFHEALMCKAPTFKCTEKLMYHYNYPRKGSLTDIYQRSCEDDIKNIN
jgi:glycosyltransferase involved in cell wall biosynthesis